MRVFGRSRNTKTPTYRRTSVTTAGVGGVSGVAAHAVNPVVSSVNAASMKTDAADPFVPVDLARTEELPIVRETLPSIEAAPAAALPDLSALADADGADLDTTPTPTDVAESDVFVSRRSPPDLSPEARAADARAAVDVGVTLFVYGWENVEPGPLSWAFPSLRAALVAVRAMRNAVEWCIVAGAEWVSVDAARAEGAVLVEQNA